MIISVIISAKRWGPIKKSSSLLSPLSFPRNKARADAIRRWWGKRTVQRGAGGAVKRSSASVAGRPGAARLKAAWASQTSARSGVAQRGGTAGKHSSALHASARALSLSLSLARARALGLARKLWPRVDFKIPTFWRAKETFPNGRWRQQNTGLAIL